MTRKTKRKRGKGEEGSHNERLEEREKEMKERMYGVNMKERRKQDERKRQGQGGKNDKVWIKIRYFSEMSNYDIHKPPEYANTQYRTSLFDISQYSKQAYVEKYPEDNPPESTSHRNIPIIQAYLSEQEILISTFPGRAVVRKESISLLPPPLTPHQWRSSPSGHRYRNAKLVKPLIN